MDSNADSENALAQKLVTVNGIEMVLKAELGKPTSIVVHAGGRITFVRVV